MMWKQVKNAGEPRHFFNITNLIYLLIRLYFKR